MTARRRIVEDEVEVADVGDGSDFGDIKFAMLRGRDPVDVRKQVLAGKAVCRVLRQVREKLRRSRVESLDHCWRNDRGLPC